MVKIKIKSNPYHKKTEFKTWDDALDEWISIDVITCPNSPLLKMTLRLVSSRLRSNKLLMQLFGAYYAGSEKVEIVFEGTDDEYHELESVCSDNEYSDKAKLSRSPICLENARDILHDVIDVFQRTRSPLFPKAFQTKAKFRENWINSPMHPMTLYRFA